MSRKIKIKLKRTLIAIACLILWTLISWFVVLSGLFQSGFWNLFNGSGHVGGFMIWVVVSAITMVTTVGVFTPIHLKYQKRLDKNFPNEKLLFIKKIKLKKEKYSYQFILDGQGVYFAQKFIESPKLLGKLRKSLQLKFIPAMNGIVDDGDLIIIRGN